MADIAAKKPRDTTYDWLRLIATCFVVVGHCAYYRMSATYGGVAWEIPADVHPVFYASKLLNLIRFGSFWVYDFHMALFFMLSGAVLALKPMDSLLNIGKGKARRLILPYFLYGWLFMFPMKYLAGFYDWEGLKLAYPAFINNIDSGHLWFLPALFWCTMIFACLAKVCTRFPGGHAVLLAVCAAIQVWHVHLPFDFFALKLGLTYLFWFAFGYCFQLLKHRFGPWPAAAIAGAFLVTALLELVNYKLELLPPVGLVLLGAAFTYTLARLCGVFLAGFTRTKLWDILIRNCFAIYLFHDPMNYVFLRVFMENNLLTTAWGCYAYYFCRIFLILLFSILLGELVRFCKERILSRLFPLKG